MFDALTNRLNDVFRGLRGRGKISEANVAEVMREIRTALLEADVNLEVGSGTQAEQTAAIMVRYEALLLKQRSALCLVVGDVTSTMACAIVAQKLWIPVAHVEAGIRSGEPINCGDYMARSTMITVMGRYFMNSATLPSVTSPKTSEEMDSPRSIELRCFIKALALPEASAVTTRASRISVLSFSLAAVAAWPTRLMSRLVVLPASISLRMQ